MPIDPKHQVAVVGATGILGKELLSALAEAGHPTDRITALASERSAGTEVEFGDETVEVERATAEALRGMAVVFLATPPDVSRTLAAAAQAAGAWVVDASDAFRADPATPLVLPQINPGALQAFRGRVVTCPSPTVAALVTLAEPLRKAFGLRRLRATALISASSAGLRGVTELQKQTADLLSGREPESAFFPHRLAFNLIPQVGSFVGDQAATTDERAWAGEAARLWAGVSDRPVLTGLAVQVPLFFGQSLSVEAELAAGASADAVRGVFKSDPACKVLDAPAERVYPMPMLVAADPTLHVGRVQVDPDQPTRVTLWAAFEAASRTAAAMVEVATLLLQRA